MKKHPVNGARLAPALKARLRQIRWVVLDVDGILTDGRIFWVRGNGAGGYWSRFFHMRDGYGIKLLLRAGIGVAVISGSDSPDIRERMRGLGVSRLFLGREDKTVSFDHFLRAEALTAGQVLYMGDDVFDLPLLERAGFSATVPEASDPVRRCVNYVTRSAGGFGAVREVAELVLASAPVRRPRPKGESKKRVRRAP